jgi:pyruvate/2-oxoglutarate/acetoin dehydrogenase E1 component
MREIAYDEAVREGLWEEMRRDQTVFVLGQDLTLKGGTAGLTKGFAKEFGKLRIKDTPISETVIAGAAIGAAIGGYRPIADMGFADFLFIAMNEIALTAAQTRFMSGGQLCVPMVILTAMGGYGGNGPEHSRSPLANFMHIPGIKSVFPSTPYDAKGLIISAIRDNNPVLFFEHKLLLKEKGAVPEEEYIIPIGKADIKKKGEDVSIIATSYMVTKALEVAQKLGKEGMSIEVVDLRSFPLDKESILDSVKKTGRALIVDEDFITGGVGAEVGMIIMEEVFEFLKAPIQRIGTKDGILPYGRLENYLLPSCEEIIKAVRKVV